MPSIARSLLAASQATSRSLIGGIAIEYSKDRPNDSGRRVRAEFQGLDATSLQAALPLGIFDVEDGGRVLQDLSSVYSLSPAWWKFAGQVRRATWAARILGYESIGKLDSEGSDRDIRFVACFASLKSEAEPSAKPTTQATNPWGLPHMAHPLSLGRMGLAVGRSKGVSMAI